MTLPLTCPCCHHPLTEVQIKALWGAYCNSKRVTPPKAGPGRPRKSVLAKVIDDYNQGHSKLGNED